MRSGEREYQCFDGNRSCSPCSCHRSPCTGHTEDAFDLAFDTKMSVKDLNDKDEVSSAQHSNEHHALWSKTHYTVNARDKIFDYIAPKLSIDTYLDANKDDADPDLLANIKEGLIGKEVRCKLYIYTDDNKKSLTLHPPNARK